MKRILFCFALICLGGFSLFGRPTQEINNRGTEKDVYIGGFEHNNQRIGIARYWLNGEVVPISDGNYFTTISSMFVKDSDVYAAGYEYSGNDNNYQPYFKNTVAMYWKNDVRFTLTDGVYVAVAQSIFVVGEDIYVAGYEKSGIGGNNIAKYWKNGVAVDLTKRSSSARAISIFVVGTDVYVAGNERKRGEEKFSAKYWKNGQEFILSDGKSNADTHSIFVLDGDVYVVGAQHNGRNWVAKYWENGIEFTISNEQFNAVAYSVFVVKK